MNGGRTNKMKEELMEALKNSDLVKYNWFQREINGGTYYVSPGIDSLNDPLLPVLVKEDFLALISVRYDDGGKERDHYRLIPVEKFIDENKDLFEMKNKIGDMTVVNGAMCIALNLLVFQKSKYPAEVINIITKGFTGNVYREDIEKLTDFTDTTVTVTIRDVFTSLYHQKRGNLVDVLHRISTSMNTLDEIDTILCGMGIK